MSRRGDVLAALKEAGSVGLSGEVLAGRLGVSRAAVAKHVAALRALGYGIEALAGTGYRLVSVPDVLLSDEVVPLVNDPFWVGIGGGLETESTNDDAKALARAGALEGTVVLAARQRSGRGRLGRVWESPQGGVYLSAILRPRVAPAQLGALPLVIGIGVARALEGIGCSPRLKWPNDVVFAVQTDPPGVDKVAGILLEMQAESDSVEWVVAGVGINVTPPAIRVARAGYVSDQTDVGLAGTAAAVLDGIAAAYREFAEAGFGPLRAEYEARSVLTGREVTVSDREGAVLAVGTVAGVDSLGRLVLDTAGGPETVTAGDVTLARPAS